MGTMNKNKVSERIKKDEVLDCFSGTNTEESPELEEQN